MGHCLALIHPMVHAETPTVALAQQVTAVRPADQTTSHPPTSLPWGVIGPPSSKSATLDGGEFLKRQGPERRGSGEFTGPQHATAEWGQGSMYRVGRGVG